MNFQPRLFHVAQQIDVHGFECLDLPLEPLLDLANRLFGTREPVLRLFDKRHGHEGELALAFLAQFLIFLDEHRVQRPGAVGGGRIGLTNELEQLIEHGADYGGVELGARRRARPDRVDECIEHPFRVFAQLRPHGGIELGDHLFEIEFSFDPLSFQPGGDRFAKVRGVFDDPPFQDVLGEAPGGRGQHFGSRPGEPE